MEAIVVGVDIKYMCAGKSASGCEGWVVVAERRDVHAAMVVGRKACDAGR